MALPRVLAHLKVVQLRSVRVQDVDSEDLKVNNSVVQECQETERFDLLDLADISYLFSDLAYVQGVVVTLSACVCMGLAGIAPCLGGFRGRNAKEEAPTDLR
jgi:hypothetical protein